MTLAFIEPFDHYVTTAASGVGVQGYWNMKRSGIALVTGLLNPAGRALQIKGNTTDQDGWVLRPIPPTTRVSFGFYAKYEIRPEEGTANFIVLSDASPNYQARILINPAGQLLLIGEGGNNFQSSVQGLLEGVIYHIAGFFDISTPGDHKCKIVVNGDVNNPFIDAEGVDLQDQSSGFYSNFGYGLTRASLYTNHASVVVDDLLLLVDEATILPELELFPLLPNGDDSVGWTRSTGANNYANVDEAQIDSDTTYNHATVVGTTDRFTLPDLGFTPNLVWGVSIINCARKEDSATQAIKTFITVDGVDHETPEKFQGLNYASQQYTWLENPESELPWTGGDVDALKTGYKLTTG